MEITGNIKNITLKFGKKILIEQKLIKTNKNIKKNLKMK